MNAMHLREDDSMATGVRAAEKQAVTSRIAARVSVVTAITFLILLVAMHAIKPELDPSWRMVSEYEIGRYGWVMQLAFLSLALSCVALVTALRSQVRTTGGRIGLAFLLLSAAGMTIAAVFTADPITASQDELTTHGNLHAVGAFLGIPGFPIAALLVSRGLLRNTAWSPVRRTLLWTAALNWVALAALVLTLAVLLPQNEGKLGPDVLIGWPNRLFVLAHVAWLTTAARHARSV